MAEKFNRDPENSDKKPVGYRPKCFKKSTSLRPWIALLLILQFPARALTVDETHLNMEKALDALQ